jgi:hypothetical protein
VENLEHLDILKDLEILEDEPKGEEESLGDDAHYLGDEDEIRTRQKLNSVATITSLRFQPISSSRFGIPLCRMLSMPMVRPTLSSDLAKLEQEFVHGYREGASVFYVTTTNEDGKTQEVLEADKASWGPIWNAKNDDFNTFLRSDPNLAHLTNMMFFVCDGNHRRQAWLNHIDRLHRDEESWQISANSFDIESLILSLSWIHILFISFI